MVTLKEYTTKRIRNMGPDKYIDTILAQKSWKEIVKRRHAAEVLSSESKIFVILKSNLASMATSVRAR